MLPCTLRELEDIGYNCYADDIRIPASAVGRWTREQAVSFFESGGEQLPPRSYEVTEFDIMLDKDITAVPSALEYTLLSTDRGFRAVRSFVILQRVCRRQYALRWPALPTPDGENWLMLRTQLPAVPARPAKSSSPIRPTPSAPLLVQGSPPPPHAGGSPAQRVD